MKAVYRSFYASQLLMKAKASINLGSCHPRPNKHNYTHLPPSSDIRLAQPQSGAVHPVLPPGAGRTNDALPELGVPPGFPFYSTQSYAPRPWTRGHQPTSWDELLKLYHPKALAGLEYLQSAAAHAPNL